MDLTTAGADRVVQIAGGEDAAYFGRYSDVVGDLTSDAVPELMDRVVGEDGNTMFAWSGVQPGTTGDLPADEEVGILAPSGSFVQPSMYLNPGDVDGDGEDDLLVGCWWYGSEYHGYMPDSGQVFLIHGPLQSGPPSTDATDAWMCSAKDGHAFIGTSGAALGDQNGDGYADFALGSGVRPIRWPGDEVIVQSTAWVVYGPVDNRAPLESVAQAQLDFEVSDNPASGANVEQAGDLNGDGLIDLVVGSPNMNLVAPTSGGVFVFHAPLEGQLVWEDYDALLGDIGGKSGSTNVGYAVSADMDVDGDGSLDLWIGAPWYGLRGGGDPDVESWGAASLVLGPHDGDIHLVDEQHALVVSTHSYAGLGLSMASLRDVDGDGLGDVAVGAPVDGWAEGTGSVTVAHGGIEGTHESPWKGDDPDLAFIHGDIESRYLGMSVAGGEDLDQDGWPDLVIGDPWYDPDNAEWAPGRIFVLFGGPR